MKKIILIVFILVVLLLLAAPGVVGMQAEARYQALVAEFQRNGLKVVRNDYQRGWLQARAETELELAVPENYSSVLPKSLRFVLRNQIIHGPYVSGHGVVPAFALIDTDLLPGGEALFPAGDSPVIHTQIDLDGSGQVLINLPVLEQSAQKGVPAILFKGAKGSVLFSPGYDEVVLDFKLPYLRIDDDGDSGIEVSGISLDSKADRGVAGLMLGSGAIVIDRIQVRSSTGSAALDVQKVRVDGHTSAEGEMVEGAFSYNLSSVDAEGAHYGPVVLDVRFGNLSGAVLAALQQATEEINSQHLPPNQQGIAMFGVMMSNGAEFLKSDPKLAIEKLHVVTPDGTIEGQLELQTEGLQWAEISNPTIVLSKLLADASLRMPEKLFRQAYEQQVRQMIMAQIAQQRMLGEQVPEPDPERLQAQVTMLADQQLDALLTQEILVQRGANVETVATLRDGLLTVNGKSFPLPVMGQPR